MGIFLASAWATATLGSVMPLFLFVPLWLLTMAWLASMLAYRCSRDTFIWFVAAYRWLTHRETPKELELTGKERSKIERERMKWT